jgi:hypothetical protein
MNYMYIVVQISESGLSIFGLDSLEKVDFILGKISSDVGEKVV